jgi:hypothetical protein
MGLWFEAMHHLECMLERIDTYLGADVPGSELDPIEGYRKVRDIQGVTNQLNWKIYFDHKSNKKPLFYGMDTYFECTVSDDIVRPLLWNEFECSEGYVTRTDKNILALRFFQKRDNGSHMIRLEFYCPKTTKKPES